MHGIDWKEREKAWGNKRSSLLTPFDDFGLKGFPTGGQKPKTKKEFEHKKKRKIRKEKRKGGMSFPAMGQLHPLRNGPEALETPF